MFRGNLFQIKLQLLEIALLSGFNCVRQYQVISIGLAGIINATVYQTEQIFKDLGHGKLL